MEFIRFILLLLVQADFIECFKSNSVQYNLTSNPNNISTTTLLQCALKSMATQYVGSGITRKFTVDICVSLNREWALMGSQHRDSVYMTKARTVQSYDPPVRIYTETPPRLDSYTIELPYILAQGYRIDVHLGGIKNMLPVLRLAISPTNTFVAVSIYDNGKRCQFVYKRDGVLGGVEDYDTDVIETNGVYVITMEAAAQHRVDYRINGAMFHNYSVPANLFEMSEITSLQIGSLELSNTLEVHKVVFFSK